MSNTIDSREREDVKPVYSDNISTRLLKGLGSNVIAQGVNIFSKIALVPLFVNAWGSEAYGEWLVLSSVVAYLSLTDLGGQVYIVNRLTQAYAKGNIKEFRGVLHTGMALFLITPAIVTVIFLIVAMFSPFVQYMRIKTLGHGDVAIITALLSLQVACSLPQGILLGVYRAVGMLSTGVMLGSLMLLLQTLFTMAGLLLECKMVLVAFLQVVPMLIVSAIAVRDLSRRFPEFRVSSLHDASWKLGRTFIKPSLHFLSIQMSQIMTIQGMILVVSMLLGPVQVVVFSTMRTIVNFVKQFLGLVSHTAWPEITKLDSLGDGKGELVVVRAVIRVVMAGSVLVTWLFYYYGQDIYELWLAKKVMYDHDLMLLFLGYIFLHVFWTAAGNVLMAVNSHYSLSRIMMVSAVLTIIAAFTAGKEYGLIGAVMAMIAGELLLPFWIVPYLLQRRRPVYRFSFFLVELMPATVALLAGLTSMWVMVPVASMLSWWTWNAAREVKSVSA